jgi:CubicO group peptidase (beta-lactamase class C family)
VTVKDLLCHRIGFQTFQSDLLNWNCNLSRKELITNMRNVKPVYSFRSQYGYCNAAFLTAGEIIPAVTDTSWDDFLKYHYFIPLKMNHTSTTCKTIIADNNACKPYTIVDDKLVLLPYANVDNLGPAASINSCVKDLANWLQMQLDSGKFEGKSVVPFEALQMTRASNTIVSDMNPKYGSNFQNYGLGWFLLDYNGKKVIRHDGGADGFVTTTCFIPQLDLGIVVLTNTDVNAFYSALRTQIMDAYMDLPYQNHSLRIFKAVNANNKLENAEVNKMREIASKKPTPSMKPEDYAGKYKNEVYGEIEIKNSNGNLTVSFSHHPFLTGKLEPMGENDFLCTYSVATYGIKKINFLTKEGKVKSVIIRVNAFVDMMDYEFAKE